MSIRRQVIAAVVAALTALSGPAPGWAALARVPEIRAAGTLAPALSAAAAVAPAAIPSIAAASPALASPSISVAAAAPATIPAAPAATVQPPPAARWDAVRALSPSALFDGVAAHDHAVSAPDEERREVAALKKSIIVGLTFAAAEYVGGAGTGTLALKADALHLASDRVVDGTALIAKWLGRKYGGGEKIEAGFGLAGALAIGALGLSMIPETVRAFQHPAPAAGWSVVAFAALSAVSNLTSAALLRDHQHGLGARGAFLHALNDAYGTLGVMAAATVSLLTGHSVFMPLATAATVALVLRVAWEIGRPAARTLRAPAP